MSSVTRRLPFRHALALVPLLAIGAACLGPAPALAKPAPVAQADPCHSQLLIACYGPGPAQGGNRGTPGWSNPGWDSQPGPHWNGRWDGRWGGPSRHPSPFPPQRSIPQPGPF